MNKAPISVDGKLHAQCSGMTLQLLPLLCFKPHLRIACHWIQTDWLPLVIYLLIGTVLKDAAYCWMWVFLTCVEFSSSCVEEQAIPETLVGIVQNTSVRC